MCLEVPIAHNRREGDQVSSVLPLSLSVELYFQRGGWPAILGYPTEPALYHNLRAAEPAVGWSWPKLKHKHS